MDITPERHRVAENLRHARNDSGLRLAEVAARLGALGHPMTESAISKIERGLRHITVEDLFAFGALYGRTPGSLLASDPTNAEFEDALAAWRRESEAAVAEVHRLERQEAAAWARVLDAAPAETTKDESLLAAVAAHERTRRLVKDAFASLKQKPLERKLKT